MYGSKIALVWSIPYTMAFAVLSQQPFRERAFLFGSTVYLVGLAVLLPAAFWSGGRRLAADLRAQSSALRAARRLALRVNGVGFVYLGLSIAIPVYRQLLKAEADLVGFLAPILLPMCFFAVFLFFSLVSWLSFAWIMAKQVQRRMALETERAA